MKFSSFSIFSSLKSSFSSSSESFSPRLVITFLNYLTVIVDPLGLKIDCMASISSSSASGSLYSLDSMNFTWPWELRSRQIRTFPCCLDRLLCSIQPILPRLAFDWVIEPKGAITKSSYKPYAQCNEVIIVLVEELEGLFELCYFLFAQFVALIHFIF